MHRSAIIEKNLTSLCNESYCQLGFLHFLLQVGDRIVSICGTSTEGMTHSQAVSLLKNASGTIELQVKKSSVTFEVFSEYSFASCYDELFQCQHSHFTCFQTLFLGCSWRRSECHNQSSAGSTYIQSFICGTNFNQHFSG